MNAGDASKTPLLPLWLWFWLGLYLVTLPGLAANQLFPRIQDIFAEYYTWSVQVGGMPAFFQALRLTNLYELVAYTAVLAGVLAIFFPHLRGAYIERMYGLVDMDAKPVIQEMRRFTASYVPHLDIRANFLRSDLFAITYPRGFRRPALGVFGGLVMLWRTDRETAEAVLLHEIAHIRQGDTLILGAGSLFERVVRGWVWIFLFLVLLPVLLYEGGAVLETWQRLTDLGLFSPARFAGQAGMHLLESALLLVQEALILFSVFLVPLAGIWTSELYADRFVMDALGSNAAIRRGLANLKGEDRGWKAVLAAATHPPARLRRWLAARYPSRRALSLLILLFPLSYLARFLVLLAAWLPSRWYEAGAAADTFALASQSAAQSLLWVFAAMAVWLLAWPLLAPAWARLFTRQRLARDRANAGVYVLCAVVPLVGATWAVFVVFSPERLAAGDGAGAPATTGEAALHNPTAPAGASEPDTGDHAVQFDGFSVTVSGVREFHHPALRPDAGNRFLALDLTAACTGEEAFPMANIFSLVIEDANGLAYYASPLVTAAAGKPLPQEDLAPGQEVGVVLGFEVPEGEKNFRLRYMFDEEGRAVEIRVP